MQKLKRLRAAVAAFILAIIPMANIGVSHAADWAVTGNTLISADSNGNPANSSVYASYITPDARYVAYSSYADNIVPGTTQPTIAINQAFLYDRTTNSTEVVSRNTNGDLANRDAGIEAVSNDGRYVLLASTASNLDNVTPDYNNPMLFLRDRQTGVTKLVNDTSQFSAIATTNAFTADGSKIAYTARPNNQVSGPSYAYIYDVQTGTNTQIPALGSQVGQVNISTDGRYLTYKQATLSGSTFTTYFHRYDLTASQDNLFDTQPGFVGPAVFSRDGTHLAYIANDSAMTLYDENIDTGTTTPVQAIGDTRGTDDLSYSSDNRYLSFGVPSPNATTRAQVDLYIADLQTSQQLQVTTRAYRDLLVGLDGDGSHILYSPNSGTDPNGFEVYMASISLPTPADTTAPVLGTPSWSANPKSVSQSSTLTVPASDNVGVTGGEYYLGDTDPGQGNGATMTYDGSNLTTTFGTDFSTGVYKVTVRAKDAAGNWSTPTTDYLVVYDPTAYRMTGKKSVTPSLSNGDVLPGLNATGQTDKAVFAFNVKYNNQGQINANSDFQLTYSTGTKCNTPAKANNCHVTSFNADSIAWLTTQGTNNSTGIFQGMGTLTIDGATSQNTFRVTGVDGGRLDPTSPDQFQMQIFTAGADPNTATPLYTINTTNIDRGNIKIIQL